MKKKEWWQKIRKPLPAKPGRPQTTKKGEKGYERHPKHKKRPYQEDDKALFIYDELRIMNHELRIRFKIYDLRII